ncbi:MAG: ROK family protein [Oscillospiraceae bacterium]|nr:ROK family protein [Oscillospiraceae bacterium]
MRRERWFILPAVDSGVRVLHIGIDIGGTNIAVGLVSNGSILCKEAVKTSKGISDKKLTDDIFKVISELCKKTGVDVSEIKSIGIGAPGAPDVKNGKTGRLVNITNAEFDFRGEFKRYTDADVFVDNDANCAAIGEAESGAARGCANVVMITLGTGVGAGIIINNKLNGGFNGAAGEIGHTTIVYNGEQCNCGNKGCYEAYASVTALIRYTKAAADKNPDSIIAEIASKSGIDGMTAFTAAKKGDKTAEEVIDKYTEYVSVGIANIINILQPEMIVIGGGISKEGEYLLNPIRAKVKDKVFTKDTGYAEIKAAELANDAGILGAAMLFKYRDI